MLASVIVGVLVLLSLILMATTVFPKIDVTEFAVVGGGVLGVGLAGFGVWALRGLRGGRAVTVIEETPSVPKSQWTMPQLTFLEPAVWSRGRKGAMLAMRGLPRGVRRAAGREGGAAGRRVGADCTPSSDQTATLELSLAQPDHGSALAAIRGGKAVSALPLPRLLTVDHFARDERAAVPESCSERQTRVHGHAVRACARKPRPIGIGRGFPSLNVTKRRWA